MMVKRRGNLIIADKMVKPPRTQSEIQSDSIGDPIVAWGDRTSGNYEIYVKRWNGTSWVEMGTGSASGGGASNNLGYSEYPSIATDSAGNPIIVWDDDTSGNWEIYKALCAVSL
ncbi:MAG: hypothetical protein AB1546_01380 [bacterium]